MENQQNFCFCTLAIGDKYRNLASLLAQDLEKYSAGTKFVILTDKPKHFHQQNNVLAYLHHPQSVKFYNDKRFVLQKSLELYDSCVFMDADMRIVDFVPEELNFLPGIVACSSCSILKHNNRKKASSREKKEPFLKILDNICSVLNLDLEKVKYVNEFLFYVTKDANFPEFIEQWGLLANYFENKGYYAGEGNIIGLAAAKSGFTILQDYEKKIKFFKDRIELVKQKKGQKTIDSLEIYLEQQRKYEYPKVSLIAKITNKMIDKLSFFRRRLHLKIKILRKANLYSKFDNI
jgi:hypothetical protein